MPPSHLQLLMVYAKSELFHSMYWSEFAMSRGLSESMNSLAYRVVQAAPSVTPSVVTMLHPGVMKLSMYFRL